MSRWQKIGVLGSLLWLIGLPIYLMTDSNRRASEFYNWCRKVEFNLAFELTAEQQHDTCWRSAKFMTPTVLAQTLIAGNAETVTLWSFMLVPLAIFWGIWGIMLATVRWKRRGFKEARTCPRHRFQIAHIVRSKAVFHKSRQLFGTPSLRFRRLYDERCSRTDTLPGEHEFTLFSRFQRNTRAERPLAKRAMRQFMPYGINPPSRRTKVPGRFQEEKLCSDRLCQSKTWSELSRRRITEWTGCVSSWRRASTRQGQFLTDFFPPPVKQPTVSISKRRRSGNDPCPWQRIRSRTLWILRIGL